MGNIFLLLLQWSEKTQNTKLKIQSTAYMKSGWLTLTTLKPFQKYVLHQYHEYKKYPWPANVEILFCILLWFDVPSKVMMHTFFKKNSYRPCVTFKDGWNSDIYLTENILFNVSKFIEKQVSYRVWRIFDDEAHEIRDLCLSNVCNSSLLLNI